MSPIEQRYKTAQGLKQAYKAQARKNRMDVHQAMDDFFHNRFLARVFSESTPRFILKGGRGMLARRIDARNTVDTDLVCNSIDIAEAVAELERIGSIDLGDLLQFRIDTIEPIVAEQAYCEGARIQLIPIMAGIPEKSKVLIDLVTGRSYAETPDIITPANRISLPGLVDFDYHVQPVSSAMADKVCAIMETYRTSNSSSRVKDLVDLVSYVTNDVFNANELSQMIYLECGYRKMSPIRAFSIPDPWRKGDFRNTHERLAKEAHISRDYQNIEHAESLAKRCVDPAICHDIADKTWDPLTLSWE